MEYSPRLHSRAFAWWAIYELIIFPKVHGYIEMAVVETFEQIQHDSKPAWAILAKTFRSLNYCRRNQEKRLLGCTPLLYIWIKSHTLCEGITFTKSYLSKASLITKFYKNTWPQPRTEEWWVLSLQDPNQLQRMAPWIFRPPLLYQCGNLSWMPLFGPWRMISYAPLLALRQFEAKQFLPATARLVSLEITYGKPEKAQLLS